MQMANHLAHKINNPLQSMTNAAFMLSEGIPGCDPQALGRELAKDIERLSELVTKLLSLPLATASKDE
jgi:nitrogen-specific signal transduction histidine kinase